MTSDQELMWNVLTNNPEFLAHRWGKELSALKGKRFHTACNQHLRFIVDNFSTEEAARTVKTWLSTYKLPLDPNELNAFDDFHAKFGRYIINDVANIKAYE